ncbi:MAG: bile acid:sodium symporter family protein [Verrucomicrobia bacterium]|nr:bile acid:sodium symporter family protein [Verrucomicrobiota bacterium]
MHRLLLWAGVLLALACVLALLAGFKAATPQILAGSAICLALAATTGRGQLREMAFTIWIVAGVVIGMVFHTSLIHFPPWFFGLDGTRLTVLIVPLLQIIMFSMGTTLSVADFARVLKMPGGVLVGLVCQFTIMPLLGFTLAHTMGLPPAIAAGFILVGVSPSGLASNVMSFIAKANVAMSVTMTALATLLSPVITPLLMKALAGEMVAIDVPSMMWDMTQIVLLPVVAGLVFHHLFFHRWKSLERIMPAISMVGILVITVVTVAPGRDKVIEVGMLLVLACFIHTTAGYALGYGFCKLLRLDTITCRTIAIEVGMQNAGLAAGLATKLGKVATLGLAPIVFGPIMNVTASVLANWWRTHPAEPEDKQGTGHSP